MVKQKNESVPDSRRPWVKPLYTTVRLGPTRIFHEFEVFICKAFRDAVVLMLPQVPDNEANGQLGLARRVNTSILFC